MATKGKKISAKLKIIGATATALFSLFSLFTGTLAWFASNNTVEATGASVSVKAADGVNFDLYYLHHFEIDQSTNKDGNYNSIVSAYSGYENAAANAVFEPIHFNDSGVPVDTNDDPLDDADNPTMIDQLWPAHQLTYAIVISSGDASSFILDSWGEVTDNNVKTTSNNLVSLSWAINIYGGAQFVNSTNSVTDDISTGFATYAAGTLTDKFTYSESSQAPAQHTAIYILSTIGTAQQSQRTILYFSIEFSNNSDTFYALDNVTNGVSYYTKNTGGNSNCYEKLSLTDLVFKIA